MIGLMLEAGPHVTRGEWIVTPRWRAARRDDEKKAPTMRGLEAQGRKQFRLFYFPSVPMIPRTAAGRSAGRTMILELLFSAILRMAST